METVNGFSYNPAHVVGTCSKCGEEMVYNVPRLGPNGGFVHKKTGRFSCEGEEVAEGVIYHGSMS